METTHKKLVNMKWFACSHIHITMIKLGVLGMVCCHLKCNSCGNFGSCKCTTFSLSLFFSLAEDKQMGNLSRTQNELLGIPLKFQHILIFHVICIQKYVRNIITADFCGKKMFQFVLVVHHRSCSHRWSSVNISSISEIAHPYLIG